MQATEKKPAWKPSQVSTHRRFEETGRKTRPPCLIRGPCPPPRPAKNRFGPWAFPAHDPADVVHLQPARGRGPVGEAAVPENRQRRHNRSQYCLLVETKLRQRS